MVLFGIIDLIVFSFIRLRKISKFTVIRSLTFFLLLLFPNWKTSRSSAARQNDFGRAKTKVVFYAKAFRSLGNILPYPQELGNIRATFATPVLEWRASNPLNDTASFAEAPNPCRLIRDNRVIFFSSSKAPRCIH